ncbi:MAG: bifunctional aspartate kinase/homoserine dehydrogenase I, partial [Bacteroidia bacterium]|nr:bifunctional aspartate kinase/homoserine dehydrogenase I [Bacteroidia bacterium]
KSGRTTTLGRGGSDYTAAILAAGLNADYLEIWTDVNGVLTANPKMVSKAFTIPEMTYSEALEMSHFGAKVLYAPTIRPVRSHGIPTIIKNTFNSDHPGTTIQSERTSNPLILTGISSIDNISILSIEGTGLQGVAGFASRFFNILASNGVNIIMITQASSEQSISIAIAQEKVKLAKSVVEKEFEYELRRKSVDPIKISLDLSLIAIVGENMKNSPGVSGKLFHTLGINGINVEAISQGSSELNITFAIKTHDEKRAINSIHDSFFLSHYKTIHLFMVGVGLIGSKLIEQIIQNAARIKDSLGIELIINGLSNSRKMLISADALDPGNYAPLLESSKTPANINQLIEKMVDYNFTHSIFIDNTASAEVPRFYERILDNNISISTPNKVAMSSEFNQFIGLKSLSKKRGVPFKYETNVAAGLPVISTLENLFNSGDQISKIEAVLSGSVSYIFNTFSANGPDFSEVVKEAQTLGFTEPDPREDLSGADVRRKILILAREAGSEVESTDIEIHSILNDACLNAQSVEDFYVELGKDNQRFRSSVTSAEKENKRLRFIASFEGGKGVISLKAVPVNHPFYALSGSDNMIVLHSNRYNRTPLVVRGPGAGADVTAAGVLAEIIGIAGLI